MQMNTVKSSNLEAVGYDREKRQLGIRFKGGGEYVYDDVPGERYLALSESKTPGAYFHQHVKLKFKFQKLAPKPSSERVTERPAIEG